MTLCLNASYFEVYISFIVMKTKKTFLNGLPELLLLQVLSREEMYGYQLIAEIRARSGEVFNFSEGSIYPILHRLVTEKHIVTRREIVNGRPRHYYRTSAKGQKHVAQLTGEWNRMVAGANAILGAQYA